MNIKPAFFTSDWHLGHERSLEFDNRPFVDLKEMHESLIKRFNATVPKIGITYFLGDIGNQTSSISKVIRQLNGTKILIIGNHDHGVNTMYNCGFDAVMFSSTLYIANQRVTMSHCPLTGVFREDTSYMKNSTENWHGESKPKHQKSSLTNEGQFHLHGHIHSRKEKNQSKKILGRQYDVGVTANNYTPVSISTIESWIAQTLKTEGSIV